MAEHSAEIAALLGIFGLLGPALIVLGVWLGSLRSATRSAHHRIDRLETILTTEFKELRLALDASVKNAYLYCPLARKSEHNGRESGRGGA